MSKRLWILSLFVCVVFFSARTSFAVAIPQLSKNAEQEIARLPVQFNGRVKPFESFAREILEIVTGSPSIGNRSSVLTVLHMIAYPEKWESEPILSVPYRPLRKELGLSPKETHISYQGLFAAGFMKRLPPIVAKEQASEKLTFLEQETMDLYNRFTVLHGTFSGDLRLIPSSSTVEAVWFPLTHLSELNESDRKKIQEKWQSFLNAYREGNETNIKNSLDLFVATAFEKYPSAKPAPWRLSLEVGYHRAQMLRVTWVLYFIAGLLFILSLLRRSRKWHAGATTLFIFAFLYHLAGIIIRVILSGRPPVSNFYESMLWLAFITALLGMLFELKLRLSYLGLSAALFGGVTLLLSEHLPLDPAIQPIVAVLRSNKWLAIHVLTIVSSYGVLTLATGIAHICAGGALFGKENALERLKLGETLYRVIQIGVILLAAGIMLGAVWANASWGRYWGWDPKETWALITLLWFLALLHARKALWIGERGLAVGTIIGFFLLLMTYYGVSFYLIGLHSYAGGHATPIPPLLIGYLITEVLFICFVVARITTRKNIHTA